MPLSENCFTFFYKISFPKRGINHLSSYLLSYTYKIALKESGFNPLCGTFSKKEKETSLCPHKGHQFNRKTYYCVPGTRTQPLICVGCSVPYWVSCAIIEGGFFEIAFFVVIDTHLPRLEALAYVLPHFDALTHVVILVSSAFIFQRFAEV